MIARIPAAFFGIVLGLAGLGNAWRLAATLWGLLPPMIAEAILLGTATVWAILVVLYTAKWLFALDRARAEFNDPVQCCFIGLAPLTTVLVAVAIAPYYRPAALLLFAVGMIGQLGFAVHRTGLLWQGERDPAATTPVLYLPMVAGCFVTAAAAAALGFPSWSAPFFGAGFFSWLAIESVLLHRLCTAAPMRVSLRPTLGIQIAPPTVGTVALLSIPDAPLILAQMMLGYAVVQILVVARLMPWISMQRFAASYWAFSFGLDALAFALMRLGQLGDRGPLAQAAPLAFGLANAVVAWLTSGTLWLLLRGALLPDAEGRRVRIAGSQNEGTP